MAAWKRKGGLEPFEMRLREGMLNKGYTAEFAERVFSQICGFGEYGFPESHSASFALLAYVSAWIKHYEPAAFLAALLSMDRRRSMVQCPTPIRWRRSKRR